MFNTRFGMSIKTTMKLVDIFTLVTPPFVFQVFQQVDIYSIFKPFADKKRANILELKIVYRLRKLSLNIFWLFMKYSNHTDVPENKHKFEKIILDILAIRPFSSKMPVVRSKVPCRRFKNDAFQIRNHFSET